MQEHKTAIVWFTNNLRTSDNEALSLATQNFSNVIGIYCFDPKQFEIDKFGFKKTGKFRANFLIQTVNNLKQNLLVDNIPLFIYNDSPHKVLSSICQSIPIDTIFYQKEFTTEELEDMALVKKHVPTEVKLTEVYDQFLLHPDEVLTKISEIPMLFTNFRKKVEKKIKVRKINKRTKLTQLYSYPLSSVNVSLASLGFEDFETHPNSAFPFEGGESQALERLNHYFFEHKKLQIYKQTRNQLIGIDYSSKFSAWLANGSISAKTIYWEVEKFKEEYGGNESTYWLVFELLWRDFFKYNAMRHKNQLFKLEGIKKRQYTWKNNTNLINAWIEGKTKEPFVNANMIELKETGWMSNRGRQNVASYFAKELLLDWRIGASYFESKLIDYDVHSNYGNWQYLSGVGNDGRDRKFNIPLQAKKYDPENKFIETWL